ncbi:MAG: hypothetical protein K6E49_03840 [Lachnospiraceae bacterium]|nr:hypothetical protein [Lachnospiraceae bacterium]
MWVQVPPSALTFTKMRRKHIIFINIAILAVILALVITVIVLIISGLRNRSAQKEPRVITITIDAPENIPLEEKELIVYESLLKAGYSPAGACGIMGNISVESPDFDTRAVNESNGAFGLFQWNDVGDRQQHLRDFCDEHNMNVNSMEGQLAYAVYELSGADPIACRLDDLLKETDDPYTAAAEFTAGFERCISRSGPASDVYHGGLYPEFYGEHYQALSKRINKAMNYHLRFTQSDGQDKDSQINITIE